MVTDKTYKKTPQEIDIEFGDLWKAMLKLRARVAQNEQTIEELTDQIKTIENAYKERIQDLQMQIYRKV